MSPGYRKDKQLEDMLEIMQSIHLFLQIIIQVASTSTDYELPMCQALCQNLTMDYIYICVCVCVCVCILGPHLQQMEVPRLGVELELQLPAYGTVTATPDLSCACDLCCSLQQHWILNPLSKARDRTRILMDTNQILNLLSHNGSSQWIYFKPHSNHKRNVLLSPTFTQEIKFAFT